MMEIDLLHLVTAKLTTPMEGGGVNRGKAVYMYIYLYTYGGK